MKASVVLAMLASMLLLSGCGKAPPPAVAADTPEPAYAQSIEAWRQEREDKLRDPDGWLSFTGSGQIAAGEHRVGSAQDNDIVLPSGAAHLGVLRLSPQGEIEFRSVAGSDARIDGEPFDSAALLDQKQEGGPTSVHTGQARFYVVRTGDVFGWRFRDPQAPALRAFDGVPHFPVDPSWRVQADWQAYPQPRELRLVTSNGTEESARVPGKAVFERDGRRYELLPIHEDGDDELFFVLADRTSGKETYGGARFLHAALPADGKVVLDFNKAINPPCALNGHVVCPLAPPENRLDLRVEAGEKTYPRAH